MALPFDDWPRSPAGTPAPSAKESSRLQSSSSYQDLKEKPKKPRHRHSAYQLAALNELYEQDEHPPLESRTSLAERLGMEVKTVNAWFQNKRASSKKRSNKTAAASASSASTSNANTHSNASMTSQSSPQCELPPISALIASVSAPAPHMHPAHLEYDDFSDEGSVSHYPDTLPPMHDPRHQSAFYAGNPNHRHLFESEPTIRRGRSRPTAAQSEELRKLYDANPHPSKEEREALGARIGMRYQSVTNWFQNQRSIAKKRREDEEHISPISKVQRTYSAFPPSSSVAHPSLAVPPAKGHPSLPSLAPPPRARRSPSAVSALDSRASSPRPSPYGAVMSDRASTTANRSRRTRPEPYQLEALKKLFHRTPTPSIEERGALALEINMDVGKVTNWFRNLRQTSRRRSKRASEGSDYDDDVSMYDDYSRNVSRAGSPSSLDERQHRMITEPAFENHEPLRVKLEPQEKHSRLYTHATHSRSSDMASEEDSHEAVTPSPASSPYPAFPFHSQPPLQKPAHAPQPRKDISVAVGTLSYSEMEKASAQVSTGVKVEDALLLLSFHHNVVR